MKAVDKILKRILKRARKVAKLREENAKDRAILNEFEGRIEQRGK